MMTLLKREASSRRSAAAGHRGIKSKIRRGGASRSAAAPLAASRDRTPTADSQQPTAFRARGGFSLIEVLLAIMLLGIAVISIAALFPAGIVQQRQSIDAIEGSIVANNAIAILRTKLRPEAFGTFEQFGVATVDTPRPTIAGDWSWLRPGFIFNDDPATEIDETGAIDIFTGTPIVDATEFPGQYPTSGSAGFPELYGVPYNTLRFGAVPPSFVFTQNERYYPAVSQYGGGKIESPQYVWDCMFRRFQGKILVAIFVYRVNVMGGGSVQYTVPQINGDLPPLPIWLDLTATLPFGLDLPSPQFDTNDGAGPWDALGPDQMSNTALQAEDNAFVVGTAGNEIYNPDDAAQAWQEPRQWIIDQNNNLHRVLGLEREDEDPANPQTVQLVRAVPSLPPLPSYYVAPGGSSVDDVVTDIWYLPLTITDAGGRQLSLTPVYATVKEL